MKKTIWIALFLACVIAASIGAYSYYASTLPAGFSLQVIPEKFEDAVNMQRCLFLVIVSSEGEGVGRGEPVTISVDPIEGANVVVENSNILYRPPGARMPLQVCEVTVTPIVKPGGEPEERIVTVKIHGEREGLKETESATINVREAFESIPLATEIRDKFVPWLAENHPELGITAETEWIETVVLPHIIVVQYYLFFSDEWEMGLQWHVTIAPHNWARIYLRRRFHETTPSYGFELSSWSEPEYEIRAIDPPEEIWR